MKQQKQITIRVLADTYKIFKSACITQDVKPGDVIDGLMNNYSKQKSKKITKLFENIGKEQK